MKPGYRRCSIHTEQVIPLNFLLWRPRLSSNDRAHYAPVIQSCTQSYNAIFIRIRSNTPRKELKHNRGRPFSLIQLADDPISSQNFLRSMLPPETMATIGPLPAFPVNAAATDRAPAPSEMIRVFSAINRIDFFVSSKVTM